MLGMEELLENNIATADLKKFEEEYHRQLTLAQVTPQLKFEYAWCLVQSCYHGDVRKGILLLQNLLERSAPLCQDKRDYLFYLAFGHTRLKEYRKSLQQIKQLLELEPNNHQALNLQQLVGKRLRKEQVSTALVAGGTIFAVGGIISALGSGSFGFGAAAFSRFAPVLLTLARR